MKVKKYRIVTDNYAGYEAQVWRLWWPFWVQLEGRFGIVNTNYTIEEALKLIEKHKTNRASDIVWHD